MSEHHGMTTVQWMTAFLGGAATGAAVALLTAPRSGKEIRKQIKSYLKEREGEAVRLPAAVKAAGGAAKNAFTQSLSENSHS